MFGILKMLFYSFVAVIAGVFIGTVPVGGRTVADRIVGAYQAVPSSASVTDAARAKLDGRKAVSKAKPAPRPEPKPEARASAKPAKPVTAGAANSPERYTDEDRQALEQMIASRTAR